MNRLLLTVSVLLSLSIARAGVEVTTPLELPLSSSPLGQSARVDWGRGLVVVEGAATTRAGLSQAQALLQGRAAAIADGQRLIAAALAGVQVDAETRVKDFELQDDRIRTRISGLVRSQVLGDPRIERMSDGSSIVYVKLSAPLYGGGSLITVVQPKLVVNQITVVNLPQVTLEGRPRFGGVILDVRGLDYRPCLCPQFFASGGNGRIWSYTPSRLVLNTGVVAYTRTLEDARSLLERGGPDQLVVRPLRVIGCNAFLDPQEAALMLAYNRVSGFLDAYKVSVVF